MITLPKCGQNVFMNDQYMKCRMIKFNNIEISLNLPHFGKVIVSSPLNVQK